MSRLGLLLLFILVGCNVSNEPASLSSGGTSDGSSAGAVGFTVAALSRSEASGMASFPISFSRALSSDTDVMFSFSGTANGGASCTGFEDYIIPALPLTIAQGSLSSVLDIVLCNDAVYEGTETLTVTISSASPSLSLTQASSTLSLQDSLPVPSVSFASASGGSIPEGASGMTTVPINLSLSHESTLPVSVQIFVGGTATRNNDYLLSADTVTFAPGAVASTVFVTVLGDGVIEVNENVLLNLFAPFNAALGAQTTNETQIADDEAPSSVEASLSAIAAVSEAVGTVNLTVTLAGVTDHATVLNYSVDFASAVTSSRRATFPGDFTIGSASSVSGAISIPAGASSVSIPVTIIDDALYEPAESIVVRLLGGPEVTVATGFESAELVISSNDAANRPLISFQNSLQSLLESNTAGNAMVRLLDPGGSGFERASGEDVTVTFATSIGTSEGVLDWVMSTISVTIPAGQTRVNIPISVLQDGIDEDDEYFEITLTPPVGYTAGSNTTHRVNILDADPSSKVSFQAASSSANEPAAGSSALSLNVFLDKASERAITVNYAVSGSAVASSGACGGAGVDVSAPGTVTIPAGLTTYALDLNELCSDTVYEGPESATYTLTSATNATLGSPVAHTVSITDQDVPPTLNLDASLCPALSPSQAAFSESDSCLRVTATLSGPTQSAVSIPLSFLGTAVKGTHYNFTTNTIAIPAGSTSASVSVTILNNALYGGARTLNVSAGTGIWIAGTTSLALSIADDELAPEVGFALASNTVAESAGAQTVQLRVNTGFTACETPISFTMSRAGTATYGLDHDFQHVASGIAASGTSTTLGYNLINDLTYEPGGAETLIVTITGASCNGQALVVTPSVFTLSITDDDPAPVVGYALLTQNVAENAGSLSVTISMDRPSTQAVTLTSALVANTPAPASTTDTADPEYSEATIPGDATLALTNVTIPAGATSATQVVTIVNDGDFEYAETAQMQISGVSGATASATRSARSFTITESLTSPYVHLSFVNNPAAFSGATAVAENVGAATTVYLALSNTPGNGGSAITSAVPVAVPITIGGTAAAVAGTTFSQDYTLAGLAAAGGTVTLPAGSSSTTFTVTPVDDTSYESTETAIFTMGTPTNAQRSGSFAAATMTITADADSVPTATITETYTDPIAEPTTSSSASFVLTVQPVGKQVVVSYAVGGTATPTADHNLASGSVTVNPSVNPQTIPLPFVILGDSTGEPIEDITVTISGPEINPVTPNATIQIDVSDPLQLVGGQAHTCGLLDGVVKCWGTGSYLGQGNTTDYGGVGQPVSSLSAVDLGTGFVAQKIDAGLFHTCALSTTGLVKCWGRNLMGELGLDRPGTGVDTVIGDAAGEMGDTLAAVAVGESVTDIATGAVFSCALTSSGRVKCWGNNSLSSLGIPNDGAACNTGMAGTACVGDSAGEVAALGFISAPDGGVFTQIAAGQDHVCALASTNRIYCFGDNSVGQAGRDDGQLRVGDSAGELTSLATFLPVNFHPNFSSLAVKKITAFSGNSCAVLTNGSSDEMVCWGLGTNGGHGQGDNDQSVGVLTRTLASTSLPVALDSFGAFSSILATEGGTGDHMCARGNSGEVLCWGLGSSGQLGTNSLNSVGDGNVPDTLLSDPHAALASTPGGGWTSVSPGYDHSCGVISYNQFKCWGLNTGGKLGQQSGNASETNVAGLGAQTF